MRLTYIVIDDFYSNPMEVREEALKLDYPPSPEGAPYPGRNSVQSMLWPNSDEMFSQLVREPVRGKRGFAHGRFRQTTATDLRGADIHIDIGTVWAGVLCLTLPEHCQGGTDFFRNREFGTDGAPVTQEDLKTYGPLGTSPDAVVTQLVDKEGIDRSKWEHAMTIPLRFNRLVLFRAWLWHTSGDAFGDRPENCRLVQLFFFESAQIAGR